MTEKCMKCFSKNKKVNELTFLITYQLRSNLSGVKHITDVNAKVSLKPHNITVCSMHYLISQTVSWLTKATEIIMKLNNPLTYLSFWWVFEYFPKMRTNVNAKFQSIYNKILSSCGYLHQACHALKWPVLVMFQINL